MLHKANVSLFPIRTHVHSNESYYSVPSCTGACLSQHEKTFFFCFPRSKLVCRHHHHKNTFAGKFIVLVFKTELVQALRDVTKSRTKLTILCNIFIRILIADSNPTWRPLSTTNVYKHEIFVFLNTRNSIRILLLNGINFSRKHG